MPRDGAISAEFKEGTGPLLALVPCGEFLEMFKRDCTLRLQTPEDLDPERTNPNMPAVGRVTATVGASNPIVARVLLQSAEILKAASFVAEIDKERVQAVLHEIKEELLICERVSNALGEDVAEILKRLEKDGVATQQRGRVIPTLPQAVDLSERTTSYLIHARRAIARTCYLPTLFFELSREHNNLDYLEPALRVLTPPPEKLIALLKQYIEPVRYLVELRNSQEHPKDKQTVVENFSLDSAGRVRAPIWYVTGGQPGAVHMDAGAGVQLLTDLAESVFLGSVFARLRPEFPWVLLRTPDENLKPEMPIRFRLSFDAEKLGLPMSRT